MEAYAARDNNAGDAMIDETKPLFKKALSECRKLDYHMFGKWAQRFDEMVERSDWKKFAMKVFRSNKSFIVRDLDLEIKQWEQGSYFNSGMFAGQISKIFLDAQDIEALEEGQHKDPMAPAKFAVGWYNSITLEDNYAFDIDKCYVENDDLTNAFYDAMEAFTTGDLKTGERKMKETMPLWETAMSGCGEIANEMRVISDRMDKIQNRSDWDQVSRKIY